MVAVRIEKVERDFMLAAAVEAGIPVLLRLEGNAFRCLLTGRAKDRIFLAPPEGAEIRLAPRESVSIHFDFRGQGVAFMARYLGMADEGLILETPDFMYRSLSRRWPRVPAPPGFDVGFIVPDSELDLDYPETRNKRDVELPELTHDLDYRDLPSLIESFKARARLIASEGKITMFKERGPGDIAEELCASFGLVLFIPSTEAGLPGEDPYRDGRIVTSAMAREFEGGGDVAGLSRLAAFLKASRTEGIYSAIWCPVVFYKYCVGIVSLLAYDGERNVLGFTAVDLVWEFTRVLAWFLKKHDYFSRESAEARKGRVVDVSPKGLLVAVDGSGPPFDLCASLDLRLRYESKSLICRARIARGFEHGGERFYGIELLGITSTEITELSRVLYGDSRAIEGLS
jgi:hypothetical protein